MREQELIELIRGSVTTRNPAVRVGIGDDCAVLKVHAGQEMVVTTDFCLEGRHFRRDWHSAESAGHRCLARGLSDVAAMGARPIAAFLSLALPADFSVRWVKGFMDGFQGLAAEHGVQLAGGDTGEAVGEKIVADVMVIGVMGKGKALQRKGARVGDGIYVSGRLGGSAAELASFAAGTDWVGPTRPQSFPEPRVELGLSLARRSWATAGMDLSDGLSSDLRKLAEASGIGAMVDAAAVPVAAGATLEQAMNGGEDYELLFTVMAGVRVPRMMLGIELTKIGVMVEGESVVLKDGSELVAGGWEHFS